MKVKIEKLDNFGRGIAYIDNKICFIENALEGEIVEIEITTTKKKYQEAKVVKRYSTSEERMTEKCPYSSICGGCNLSHLNYKKENKFKEEKVKDLVKRFSNLENINLKEIMFHQEDFYRNKIVLHGKNNKLGLYKKETNEIVEIDNCLLVNDRINEIIKILQNINKTIEEATVKTSNDETEVLVNLKGKITNYEELISKVDVLIINNKVLTPKNTITTTIGNYKFIESSDSFFQVNKTLTKNLYDCAKKIVKKERPNKVLDLYCGTGTIGIYISKYAKEIIGIDYNESNIKDANKNKVLNNLTNISFICNKVENEIDKFKAIDLIIVDPPRKGLDNKTKDHLKQINSKSIVYISCDPVTLIRDLNDLSTNYDIDYLKPFNMFPRTYHVECVCVLKRR